MGMFGCREAGPPEVAGLRALACRFPPTVIHASAANLLERACSGAVAVNGPAPLDRVKVHVELPRRRHRPACELQR
jgi:hypothetical protein